MTYEKHTAWTETLRDETGRFRSWKEAVENARRKGIRDGVIIIVTLAWLLWQGWKNLKQNRGLN